MPPNNCTNWATSQTENLAWKNRMVVPASTFGECWQLHQLDNQPNRDRKLDSIFYLEESVWFSIILLFGNTNNCTNWTSRQTENLSEVFNMESVCFSILYFLGMLTTGQPAKMRMCHGRIWLLLLPLLFRNANNCTNWTTSQTEILTVFFYLEKSVWFSLTFWEC